MTKQILICITKNYNNRRRRRRKNIIRSEKWSTNNAQIKTSEILKSDVRKPKMIKLHARAWMWALVFFLLFSLIMGINNLAGVKIIRCGDGVREINLNANASKSKNTKKKKGCTSTHHSMLSLAVRSIFISLKHHTHTDRQWQQQKKIMSNEMNILYTPLKFMCGNNVKSVKEKEQKLKSCRR